MMKRKTKTTEDPVVLEVRAARARLWEQAGGTMSGLSALVKRRAAALRKRGIARKRHRAA